ncbi:hypothetical protein [Erythrobacter alti]|uniref:beta strand repeat-containing protein n=1 Tax=Erythrobacter alti TaxID=1896145 RepID=UPI0030F45CDC
MTKRPFAKPSLLRSCAITALLVGATFAAQGAQAQGFRATPTVVQGTVTIDDMAPGETRVTVTGRDAVVDWQPFLDQQTGQAEIFLPDGNLGVFLGTADFAILNRILPDQLNSPTRFEGLVQAFLTDANGGVIGPGGFVAFYSPSGILVGPTGRFEVPQLMLTSQDVDLNSFTNFANGIGPLFLNGSQGAVNIQFGASFVGAPEDSFMIVASPQISMAGDAYYNGSIAYVASSAVQMTHSSGLFDIIVFDGAPGGVAIDHSGSSGGPSSTGAGDEHVIYGVTAGAVSGDRVSMLFSGNLGFDPAVSAGVVNGDIILSANYNVAGRTVDGDSNRRGANSYFDGRSFTPTTQADIFMFNVDATSNLLAISTGTTALDVADAISDFDGDVTLVGREQALVSTFAGAALNVAGDLFVSARNFGLINQGSFGIDAIGGLASVLAESGTSIDVAGLTMVTADAVAGLDFINNAIGSGTAGQAEIIADGGAITFNGTININAIAQTDQMGNFPIFGAQTGGRAVFISDFGGSLSTSASLQMDTTARAGDQDGVASLATGPADATGGSIVFGTGSGGGTVEIGALFADANGVAGPSVSGDLGATGQGGTIAIDVLGGGDVQVTGSKGATSVTLNAVGFGGNEDAGGLGGSGIGGSIDWTIDGSTLGIVQAATGDASGIGGSGTDGGDGSDNSVSLNIINGAVVQLDSLSLSSSGIGGNAIDGTAGSGFGGNATLNVINSTLDVGFLDLSSVGISGLGLTGGLGIGGDATATLDGATVTANSFGITSYGQGQKGTGNLEGGSGLGSDAALFLRNGTSLTALSPFGGVAVGSYGEGSSTQDANAGDGTGGFVLFEADSGSTATLSQLQVNSIGFAGTSTNGTAGDSFAGTAIVNLAGNANIDITGLFYAGSGAFSSDGTIGGSATAGSGILSIAPGTSLSAGTALFEASAFAGNGTAGAGGAAVGGDFVLDLQGTLSVASSANFDATATGGSGTGGDGGSGTGGTIQFANDGGLFDSAAATVTLDASGTGGDALAAGFNGGDGTGGSADISTLAAGLTEVGSLQVSTNGIGGSSIDLLGGLGQGGQTSLLVAGSSASTLLANGDVELSTDGTGGESASGTGGDGEGGTASATVQDLASIGLGNANLNLSANGTGASGDIGGSALGGMANLVNNSSGLSAGSLDLQARAVAGDGTTTGGDASGGTTLVDLLDATLDLTGDLDLNVGAMGGSGVTGGDATGGDGTISVTGSFVNIGGGFSIQAPGGSGFDPSGSGTGGNAFGGNAALLIDNSTFTAANPVATLDADAIAGGSAGPGVGGDATGGTTLLDITNGSIVDLGADLGFASLAVSGGSNGGDGGSGFGGSNLFSVSNGSTVTLGNLTFETTVTGNFGATGGNATGGSNTLDIAGSSLDAARLTIFGGIVSRGDGASGIGGTASVQLSDGALANFGEAYLETYAEAVGANATTEAGSISIAVNPGGSPSFATFGTTEFFNDALGGTSNTAGQFTIFAGDGGIDFTDLLVSNLADIANPDGSNITADGGAITFADFLTVNTTGNMLLSYANGGTIIGGPGPDDLTATFDITASDTILIDGDDAAMRSIAALESTYTSADIDVGADTNFGGTNVVLVSSNTAEQAVLGGATAGSGYSLLQAEADAILAETLTIILPDVTGADIDGIVNDQAFTGSGGGGFSRIELNVDGSLDIAGALALDNAGASDVLAINATQLVQLTLPTGSIRLESSGAPSGTLQVDASRFVAADLALIAQIASDPLSQAVADALLDDGGASAATDFIFADRAEFTIGEYMLTQNTGANEVYGGITVGAGGLLITQQQGAQGLLQVIAFGQQDLGGSFTTNDDWFALVEFAVDRAAAYTAEATFNNCIIVTGECPTEPEPEPVDPEIPSTNHVLIEEPITFPEIGEEGAAADFRFGFDFPRLLDSALISEEELIDEPVTSGGDSAVHSLSGTGSGDDGEGEE